MVAGIHRSGKSPTDSPKNSAGATPMISNEVLSIVILRPTTCGSRLNLRFQNPWLIPATGEAPATGSTSVQNERERRGGCARSPDGPVRAGSGGRAGSQDRTRSQE